MADDEFYSFDEALNELRLKEEELKRLVAEGEIRAFREGEIMKLRRGDVEELGRELGPYERVGESYLETAASESGSEGGGDKVYDGTRLNQASYEGLRTVVLALAQDYVGPLFLPDFNRKFMDQTRMYREEQD